MENLETTVQEMPTKKCANVDAQAGNMRNNLVFQRNMIPAHKYVAEEGSTSDSHDGMLPQKNEKILDCGWARGRDCGDQTKRTNFDGE